MSSWLWAPDSHQTMSSLIVSSLLDRSIDVEIERVQVGRLDPVGHQRELQDAARGVLPEAALAGDLGRVEEVRPALGYLAGRLVGVVGEDDAIGDVADSILRREPVEDLVLLDERVVDLLEEGGVGVEPEVVADVDDVPRDVVRLDLRLDRRVRGLLGLRELHAGQRGVRHQPAFALRFLVDATERGEGQGRPFVLRGRRADVRRPAAGTRGRAGTAGAASGTGARSERERDGDSQRDRLEPSQHGALLMASGDPRRKFFRDGSDQPR